MRRSPPPRCSSCRSLLWAMVVSFDPRPPAGFRSQLRPRMKWSLRGRSAELLVLVEVLQLLQLFLVEIVLVLIEIVVVQVLVLLILVVEGKPVIFELVFVFVELATQLRGFHRRFPGPHDDILRHLRFTTRPPPGRPGRPSCDRSPATPACGGG